MQNQFKEWCSTLSRIASPRMGSLLFLTQESIKQILSRATRIQKIQGRQVRVRSKQILGNKNKANSKQKPKWRWSTNFTTHMSITCQGQGVYRDISWWYIGMILKTNFSTNKHMAKDKIKRPKLKKIDILDSFKYSRDHAKLLQRVAWSNRFPNKIYANRFGENRTKNLHHKQDTKEWINKIILANMELVWATCHIGIR